MLKPTSFLERLAAYAEKTPASSTPFRFIEMQHFGAGITAVHDSLGEYDVYFDPDLWDVIFPQIWGDGLYPPAAKEHNLGILPGVGRAPKIRSFIEALYFAKGQLEPKASWHAKLPAVIRVKKPAAPIRTFEQLVKGRKWKPILRLLKKKGASINVAESEVAMGSYAAVVLNQNGFIREQGKGGLSAAYTSNKPTHTPIKPLSEIWKLSHGFDDSLPSEEQLVADVLRKVKELRERK